MKTLSRKPVDHTPETGAPGAVEVSDAALTQSELVARLNHPQIESRIILTPLLNPKDTIGAASLDVRLGNQFLVLKREAFALVDIGEGSFTETPPYAFQERVVKAYGSPFVLHPRQLVLGSTLEYVQLPKGLLCYVVGKSTWGRMGLIIATATKVDPGFKGCITLEIVNEGEIPIVLYPGLPIAQLVVHHAKGDHLYQGRYDAPVGPEFPKFRITEEIREFWLKERLKSRLDKRPYR